MTPQETGPAADPTPAQIKAFFIAQRGYWRPWTETTLGVCPGFVQQYARYAGYPARTGPLSPRVVELIYIALDASSSHLFASGLQTHMKRALEVGASPADVFDVLHLVAVQGVASVGQAAEIVAELAGLGQGAVPGTPLQAASQAPSPAPLPDPLQARIGRLAPAHALALDAVARLDPGYVEVLLDFIEHGRPQGGLSPAERSLVQLALHACFTAFNRDAVRQIAATALAQGLSPAELLQAIQLGAHLSVHGSALGADVYRQLSVAD